MIEVAWRLGERAGHNVSERRAGLERTIAGTDLAFTKGSPPSMEILERTSSIKRSARLSLVCRRAFRCICHITTDAAFCGRVYRLHSRRGCLAQTEVVGPADQFPGASLPSVFGLVQLPCRSASLPKAKA